MTPKQQQKRASKLLKYQEEPDLTKLEMLLEMDESIEDKHEEHKQCMEDMGGKIVEAIQSIVIPEPKDETENFKAIMDKLNEPDEIEITLNII